MKKTLIIIIILNVCIAQVSAQKFPERKNIRSGNTLYQNKNYAESEVEYRRALEKTPSSYEALFNLSNALYKQERYDEAAQLATQAAGDSTHIQNTPEAYYNSGNALFKQRKLEEALEAYKNALRRNPNDQEAKFNLAYTKKLLEKDQNKDNKDQNKDKQDPKQDPNKDKQDPDKEDQNQQPKPKDNSIDKSEAENMLNAMQGSEDNTKKKVDAQKVKSVGNSGKNW